MRIIKDEKTALREERRKREAMEANAAQSAANIDYIAMMTDVELPEEGENDAQPEI